MASAVNNEMDFIARLLGGLTPEVALRGPSARSRGNPAVPMTRTPCDRAGARGGAYKAPHIAARLGIGSRLAARGRRSLRRAAVMNPVRRSRTALAIAALSACSACKGHRGPLRSGIGVQVFHSTQLVLAQTRTPDAFVDAIRPGRLVIPTYDGSNQATHPDVLVERDAAGVHVTMAMTPYPFSDRRHENPSLVVSRTDT